MNYKITAGLILLLCMSVKGVERDYKEQMEAAIVTSDSEKVDRLLTRNKKLSLRRFKDMVGLSEDIVEERRLLTPSGKEALGYVLSIYTTSFASVGALFYYLNLFNMRHQVRFRLPGRYPAFKMITGGMYCASLYGLYRYWAGPRERLAKSLTIKYTLEDFVKDEEEKKKQRS